MKASALIAAIAAAVALAAVAASASSEHAKHEFETPKGTVIVTVQHGPAAHAPAAAAAEESSEESSAAAAEESSEESSTTEDLQHFTLPPEPAAAKGYRPLSCPGEDPCEEQQQQQQETAPCTENCEAEQAASNAAAGAVVMSQPIGVGAAGPGYMPARGSQSGPSVDGASWTVVPQTGVDTTTSLPTNDVLSQMPSAAAAPAAAYVSPEERRAARLEQLEAAEKQERAQEKSKMHGVMQQHQANLAKIEAMSRALRWQYTQLRRQHNLLRAHISANKAAYDELGGDNEYKGTDLDIEATPNTYETLDDIPAGGVKPDAAGAARMEGTLKAGHAREASLLAGMHKSQASAVEDIVGKGASHSAKASSGLKAADDAVAEAEAAKF